MSEKSVEKRLEALEKKIKQLEENLPICPACGYVLTGCEHEKHHMQCYSCGCWWNLEKPLNDFTENKGFKGNLPKAVIPNRRKYRVK